ncbi:MAG: hypothetical protein K0R78_3039 [Pelosinus sp.]|nr:hypothetical protein [Pelosinus sp.]
MLVHQLFLDWWIPIHHFAILHLGLERLLVNCLELILAHGALVNVRYYYEEWCTRSCELYRYYQEKFVDGEEIEKYSSLNKNELPDKCSL